RLGPVILRPLIYPSCLLVGALLVIVAGTLHPDLVGDGAAQLTTIAQCRAWRAIHWTFLFSFPLALTGLVGLARVHAGNPGESAVAMGLALVFREDTKADQAAFVLPVAWQLVTAIVMLRPVGTRG